MHDGAIVHARERRGRARHTQSLWDVRFKNQMRERGFQSRPQRARGHSRRQSEQIYFLKSRRLTQTNQRGRVRHPPIGRIVIQFATRKKFAERRGQSIHLHRFGFDHHKTARRDELRQPSHRAQRFFEMIQDAEKKDNVEASERAQIHRHKIADDRLDATCQERARVRQSHLIFKPP